MDVGMDFASDKLAIDLDIEIAPEEIAMAIEKEISMKMEL